MENYTPELSKSKKELFDYIKKHNLSLLKDYSKDPIHGKTIGLLLLKINRERDKIQFEYPLNDLGKSRKNYLTIKIKKSIMKKMKKEKLEEAKSAKGLKEKTKKTVKASEVKGKDKETKKSDPKRCKYDYPLIDGREMTSAEKKKYRMEMRKKNQAPKDKKETKGNKEKSKDSVKPEKSKKDKASSKKPEKSKKKAKSKKEED
jgi:hypothetical protein|nr:MAG TPA: hypothetical protein [Caudoviricetes sp.]